MAKDKGTPEFIKLSVLAIALMGGKDTLPIDEQGPLDTPTNKEHPLYDERLKKIKMSPEWVDNIAVNGIKEAIEVVFLNADGTVPDKGDKGTVPFAVNGRQRVRGGRLAGKKGDKVMETWCKVATLDDAGMMNDMITLNVHHEDSTSVKIAKAKRYLDMFEGETEEQKATALANVARAFSVKPATINMWLLYDKTAIAAVKSAVNSGKIPAVTGMDIARSGNAEVQQKALDAVLALGTKANTNERSGQAAKAKRAIANAQGKSGGLLDKKSLKRFLTYVESVDLPKGTNAATQAWWEGIEAMCIAALGLDGVDTRLAELIAKMDSEPATTEAIVEVKDEPTPTPKAKKGKPVEVPVTVTEAPKAKKGKGSANAKSEPKPAATDGDDE